MLSEHLVNVSVLWGKAVHLHISHCPLANVLIDIGHLWQKLQFCIELLYLPMESIWNRLLQSQTTGLSRSAFLTLAVTLQSLWRGSTLHQLLLDLLNRTSWKENLNPPAHSADGTCKMFSRPNSCILRLSFPNKDPKTSLKSCKLPLAVSFSATQASYNLPTQKNKRISRIHRVIPWHK